MFASSRAPSAIGNVAGSAPAHAGTGVLEEPTGLADDLPNFTYVIMAEGDHVYTGLRPQAWDVCVAD